MKHIMGIVIRKGKTVTLGIRPEDLNDAQIAVEASQGNTITTEVKLHEMLGSEIYLYFDFNGVPMTARVNARSKARIGDTVKLALDLTKAHFFDPETEEAID